MVLCTLCRIEPCANLMCQYVVNTLIWAVFITPIFLYTGHQFFIVAPAVVNGSLYALDMAEEAGGGGGGGIHLLLTYNLSVVFSVRNPSINIFGMDYKDLAAEPLYGSEELGPGTGTSLPSFKLQGGMATTVRWDGHGRHVVGAKLARKYAVDAARGFFIVEVKLQVKEGSTVCYFLCTLYFPAPVKTTTGAGGAPNLFYGDECMTLTTD